MNSLLLVGLGNPGKEYENTRHNAGLDFIRMLCDKYKVSLKKEKLVNGYYTKLNINDCSVVLSIPDTFMNESGLHVSKAKKFFQVKNHEILIVHDELDLENGCIRLKDSGGHGGHNGLRDIIKATGQDNFMRIRIGIGHPGNKEDVTNWVLTKFSPNEKKLLLNTFSKFEEIFEMICNDEISEAQKILNTK